MDAGPAGIHDNGVASLLYVVAVAFAFVAAFAITDVKCNYYILLFIKNKK